MSLQQALSANVKLGLLARVVVAIWSGLILLWRSLPLLLVSAAFCIAINLLGLTIVARTSLGSPPSDYYLAIYLAEFSALLVFAAITYAVVQWKVTSHLQILSDQATYYRNLYFDLAYKLQKEISETPGVINLKGVAESLDSLIFTANQTNWDRLNTWFVAVAGTPEANSIPPMALVGVLNLKVPIDRVTLWRATTQTSLTWVLFAMYVAFWFAISLAYSQNLVSVGFSVAAVATGVEAVRRFLA